MNTIQNTITSLNTPIKITYGSREQGGEWAKIYECRGLISNEICAISKDLFILIKNIGLEQQNLDNIPLSNQTLYPNSETQSGREEGLFSGILREGSHHPTESRAHVKIEFTNNLDEENKPFFLLTDISNDNALDFTLEKGVSKRLVLSFNKKVVKRRVGFTITNNGQKILDTILKNPSHRFALRNKTKEMTIHGNNSHYILPKRNILDFEIRNVSLTKKNNNSRFNAIHSPYVSHIQLEEARHMAQGPRLHLQRISSPKMSQKNLIDKRDANPYPQAGTLVGRFSMQNVIMNTIQNTITSLNTPIKITYGSKVYGSIEDGNKGTKIYESRGLISNEICAISKPLFILITNIGLEQQNLDNIRLSNQIDYSNAGTESDTEDEILDDILSERSHHPESREHVKIEFTNNLDENKKPFFLLTDFSYDNVLEFTLEKGESKGLVLSFNKKVTKGRGFTDINRVGFTITNNGQKILDTLLKKASNAFASRNKTKEKTARVNNSHYILPHRTILNFNVSHVKSNKNSLPSAFYTPSISDVPLQEARNMAQGSVILIPSLPRVNFPQMSQINLNELQTDALSYCSQETVSSRHIHGMQPVLEPRNINVSNSAYRKIDFNPYPQARTLAGRYITQNTIARSRIASAEKNN